MRNDKELNDIFTGYIAAKKVFYACKSLGVDMKKLSKSEHEHYAKLKKDNYKVYCNVRLRIMSYLSTLDEMIIDSL